MARMKKTRMDCAFNWATQRVKGHRILPPVTKQPVDSKFSCSFPLLAVALVAAAAVAWVFAKGECFWSPPCGRGWVVLVKAGAFGHRRCSSMGFWQKAVPLLQFRGVLAKGGCL